MATKVNKGANYLLNKDDVGKSKPTTRDLPEDEHQYGKPDIKDPEGVAEVTRSWKLHEQSKKSEPDVDFKKLNKMSVANKALTAKENYEFKKTHEIKMKGKEIIVEKPKILPPQEFTYGMPLKPSTPIKKVIGHGYAEEGEEAQMKKTQLYEVVNKKQKLPGPKPTKASTKVLESTKMRQQDKKSSDFKLARFKKVSNKTDTHNKKA